MLVVINRELFSGDDVILVLNTDDGVVQKMNFNDAVALDEPVSGLVRSVNSLSDKVSSFSGRHIYTELKVYWSIRDGALDSILNNIALDLNNIFKYDYLRQFPVCLTLILIGRMSNLDAKLCFDGKVYDMTRSDNELFLLLVLYALKYKMHYKLSLTDAKDNVLLEEFSYLNNALVFERGSSTYFCDNICTFVVSNKTINIMADINKKLAERVKYKLMRGVELNLLTDEVFVGKCKDVVINDDKTYLFSLISMDRIRLTSDNAKLEISRLKFVDTIYINCKNREAVNVLHKSLLGGIVKNYTINKELFDGSFVRNLLLRMKDVKDFTLMVTGVETSEDAEKVLNQVFQKSEYSDILNHNIINSFLYNIIHKLGFLAGLVPPEFYDPALYIVVKSKGVREYIDKNCEIENLKGLPLEYLNNELKGYLSNAVCYSQSVDKFYHLLMTQIINVYKDISGVAEESGSKLRFDSYIGFSFEIKLHDADAVITVRDSSEYEMVMELDKNVTHFVSLLRDKYNAEPDISGGGSYSHEYIKLYYTGMNGIDFRAISFAEDYSARIGLFYGDKEVSRDLVLEYIEECDLLDVMSINSKR